MPGCLQREKDGGWGWVVVAAVTLSQMLLGGICLSGGLFYVVFRNAFNSTPFATSWLCALPITVWFYSSPIGSFLTNRYSFRTSGFIGGIIAAVGLCLGAIAPNFGFLFFSHGVLTGIGFGINYTAGMTAVNVYFDKYKTLATGLCSIGHNAGLVIYSVFVIFLEETYGWRGSLLIHGGITFHMCLFALLLAPITSHPVAQKKITGHHNEKEIEALMLGSNDKEIEAMTQDARESEIESIKQEAKKKRKSLNLTVFRKSAFICFCLSNILVNLSQGIYILHLPSYSKEIGFKREDLGTVLTVYGITNVIGKIVYSMVGQHPRTDVTLVYTVSLVICGVCIGLTPVFITRVGMLTLASLVGFFYCVTGALLAAVIFRIVGYDRFADGVGMAMPFKATGNLIGGPLSGFLYAKTGDYSASFYVGGLCMVLGAVFMVPPIIKHRRDERKQTSNKRYTVCEKEVEALAHSNIEPDKLINAHEDKKMLNSV